MWGKKANNVTINNHLAAEFGCGFIGCGWLGLVWFCPPFNRPSSRVLLCTPRWRLCALRIFFCAAHRFVCISLLSQLFSPFAWENHIYYLLCVHALNVFTYIYLLQLTIHLFLTVWLFNLSFSLSFFVRFLSVAFNLVVFAVLFSIVKKMIRVYCLHGCVMKNCSISPEFFRFNQQIKLLAFILSIA